MVQTGRAEIGMGESGGQQLGLPQVGAGQADGFEVFEGQPGAVEPGAGGYVRGRLARGAALPVEPVAQPQGVFGGLGTVIGKQDAVDGVADGVLALPGVHEVGHELADLGGQRRAGEGVGKQLGRGVALHCAE